MVNRFEFWLEETSTDRPRLRALRRPDSGRWENRQRKTAPLARIKDAPAGNG
jgi:hypothetical protein